MSYSSDIFSSGTQQDFKTGGDGAKSYNWFAKNTANADAMDANTTNAGFVTLNLNATNSGMGATYITGPYIYQLVGGDFDVETSIVDNADQNFEQAGLLVASDADQNLHAYIINYRTSSTNIAARSGDGTTETSIGSDSTNTNKRFRITRAGNVFTFYEKLNAGDVWTLHGSVTRSDLGSTVRVALYAGSNNTNNNYVAQFDFLTFHSNAKLYQDFKHTPAMDGGTDGTSISEGTALMPVVEPTSTSVSQAIKMAVRFTVITANVDISLSGTNASLVALAPDDNGKPGTWGSYGATLSLTSVGTTNKCFWVKTKGDAADAYGFDSTVTLTSTSLTDSSTDTATIKRRVAPALSILGSSGAYYLGIDWGSGVYWRHNSSAGGDISLWDTAASYADITYAGYSQSGDTTTFDQKTLASGLTLDTVLVRVSAGVYHVKHTITSTTERWMRLEKWLRSSSGSAVGGSSSIKYFGTTHEKQNDAVWFQTTALQRTGNPNTTIGMVPGNGFDNDWCLFNWDYTSQTSWYNSGIAYSYDSNGNGTGAWYQFIRYGVLKNGSLTDYTMHIPANTQTEYSYVIFSNVCGTQAELNKVVYSSYHDSYTTASSRSDEEKMLWATSHQLKRLKRHILVEGAKELVIAPSALYSAMISVGDFIYQALGLAETDTLNKTMSILHRLGPPDGGAASGSIAGSAGNNLDGTHAIYLPWFELYAKQYLSYVPDATALQVYLDTADSYADTINNHKLLPDTSTRLAHYYSDTFAGPESTGYGDFESAFTFPQENETRDRWTAFTNTSPAATRVGTDGSVTPHGGSYMAKVPVSGGAGKYTGIDSMRLAVPASKQVTLTGFANIPSAFSSGGAFIQLNEYNASMGVVTTTKITNVTSTSGWEEKTLTVTLNASTVYIKFRLESDGEGTAYWDDVQITLDNPASGYDGLLWQCSIMPPQIKGDTLSPSLFGIVWGQANMKSLKVLLGASWTQSHQDALDLIDGSFPNAYWLDSNHNKITDDVYHPYRKAWLSSWALFSHWIWFIVNGGEKIFTDQQIIDITTNYPKSACGYSYGDQAYKGWVCKTDGSSVSGAEYTAMWLNDWTYANGEYVNAGVWLWASDMFFHSARERAGISGAETDKYKRLMIEVKPSYNSHESINSVTGGVDDARKGYGTNAVFLTPSLILSASNATSNGADLAWTSYPGTDFVNYKVCRSTTTPVLVTDVIYTITNQATLAYTDSSGSGGQHYYYAIFVTKTDDTTVKSNEISVITLISTGYPLIDGFLSILLEGVLIR